MSAIYPAIEHKCPLYANNKNIADIKVYVYL